MGSDDQKSPSGSSDASVSKATGSKGRPKGTQGDSLIRRSREVLGLDRMIGIQRRARSTKDDTSGEPKSSTRREQVLEAQRAHRMRTKIYIKELESEVLRLREVDAAAQAKLDLLTRRNDALLELLRAHGIQPPPETDFVPDHTMTEAEPALTQTQGTNSPESPSQIRSRDGEQHGRTQLIPQEPLQLLPDNGDLSVVPSLFLPQDRLPDVVQTADPTSGFPFDDSQAELDFILTLERYCMNHLHDSHFHPIAPSFNAQHFYSQGARPVPEAEDEPEAIISGHVLTTAMPLWQKLRQDGHATTSSSPDARRSELTRLLSTSYRLGLRGEIAPVQILEIVKYRANEVIITVGQLQSLAAELLKHLKCYGFGTVVEENIVRELVARCC